jgi:hypothetical protein
LDRSIHSRYYTLSAVAKKLTHLTTAIMGVMEKIKEIEAEMARTQKNKATNYHLGSWQIQLLLRGKVP